MSTGYVTARPISLADFHAQALACGMTETASNQDGSPVLVGPSNDHALYGMCEQTLADGETHVSFVMRGFSLDDAFSQKVPRLHGDSEEYYALHCFGPLSEPSRTLFLDAVVAEFGVDRQMVADALGADEQAVLVHGLELVKGGFNLLYHAPSYNLNVYVEDDQVLLIEANLGQRSVPPIEDRRAA